MGKDCGSFAYHSFTYYNPQHMAILQVENLEPDKTVITVKEYEGTISQYKLADALGIAEGTLRRLWERNKLSLLPGETQEASTRIAIEHVPKVLDLLAQNRDETTNNPRFPDLARRKHRGNGYIQVDVDLSKRPDVHYKGPQSTRRRLTYMP